MTDEQIKDQMYEDIGKVCKQWRIQGIEANYMAGVLLAMALACCERCNVPYEAVMQKIRGWYGEILAEQRPHAKA